MELVLEHSKKVLAASREQMIIMLLEGWLGKFAKDFNQVFNGEALTSNDEMSEDEKRRHLHC